MNRQKVKNLIVLLTGLMCSLYVDGQTASYVKMKGDTYYVDMPAGWELCTGEKINKVPMKQKIAGYEATWTTRIHPDHKLGVSVAILEFKGCKDYMVIQKKDSLSFMDKEKYDIVRWSKSSTPKVKRSVELVCVPTKHPETGKEEVLKMKKWYVQGKENVWLIDFASTSTLGWTTWLPEMEKVVQSLREVESGIVASGCGQQSRNRYCCRITRSIR